MVSFYIKKTNKPRIDCCCRCCCYYKSFLEHAVFRQLYTKGRMRLMRFFQDKWKLRFCRRWDGKARAAWRRLALLPFFLHVVSLASKAFHSAKLLPRMKHSKRWRASANVTGARHRRRGLDGPSIHPFSVTAYPRTLAVLGGRSQPIPARVSSQWGEFHFFLAAELSSFISLLVSSFFQSCSLPFYNTKTLPP